MVAWQPEYPGLEIVAGADELEVRAPAGPGSAHEAQFALVLDEFLRTIDRGPWPDTRAAETLAKYELLARALTAAA